jgi:hypothetical protein
LLLEQDCFATLNRGRNVFSGLGVPASCAVRALSRLNWSITHPGKFIAQDQCPMQWCGSPAAASIALAADFEAVCAT